MSIELKCLPFIINPIGAQAQLGLQAAKNAGVINDYDQCVNLLKVGGPIAAKFGVPPFISETFAHCVCRAVFPEDGPQWKHDPNSFGAVAGAISAVYALQRNHSEVFFQRRQRDSSLLLRGGRSVAA